MISVVIPTLDAESSLPATLECLVPAALDGLVGEVIVADGGSTDKTLKIADQAGCVIVKSQPGRGRQMAAGARAARKNWLMFLHADTIFEDGWMEEVGTHLENDGGQAAVFRFKMASMRVSARMIEKMVQLRSVLLALPYGDQGLLIEESLYNQAGGFADLPLMEDVDLIRRIGRRRLKFLKSAAITAPTRYELSLIHI